MRTGAKCLALAVVFGVPALAAGGCGSDSAGGGGSAAVASGAGGSAAIGGSTASVTSTGAGASSGSGGMSASTGPDDGLRSGPFKVLVLDKTLEFHHDSIPAGEQMLGELGQTADADLPEGAKAGSQFTVDIANEDLTDFTEENLKNYELLFWMNPTGTVFSSFGAAGTTGMAAIQSFMMNGGAWAGVHSATDFEKTGGWPFYQELVGGAFVNHESDGTPGTVVIDDAQIDHPVVRGLPKNWDRVDEWYHIDTDPKTLPGFTVLATLAVDQRGVSWIHELAGGGRMFYTIQGHNSVYYSEPLFRKHVLQGILWAVHRMK